MPSLNPQLFRALQAAFGEVRIENDGELRRVEYLPDWQHAGRLRAQQTTGGEAYRVSCPFCSDARQRLYFNYQWAERDPETGDDNLHLVHCFNENCVNNRVRQRELVNRVYPLGRSRQAAMPAAAAPAPPPPPPSLPDGLLMPINRLESTHPAASYLSGRGFDLYGLWNAYEVYYGESSLNTAPRIVQQIVIPVYTLVPRLGQPLPETRLAGWQARYIGPCPADTAKYLSCKGMKKSHLLYGLPAAVHSTGPIVLVEGPTDVWRLGSNAVALFGKDMSERQQQLLDRYFAGRPVVVFLDRDARDEAVQLRDQLRRCGVAAALAELPPGRDDVGDCTHDEAWHQVQQAAEQIVPHAGI